MLQNRRLSIEQAASVCGYIAIERDRHLAETITVNGGRTSNASGNIAGSVISMLDAVRMMHSLGVSEVEVGHMASLNPARLLRLDNECGSIEKGKRADLVAVDQDGNVSLTIVGGEIVYRR